MTVEVKAAGIADIIDMEYDQLMEIEIDSPYVLTIYNLTEEEKILIYKITYAESGNQDIEGQRAVIEVILNRLQSEKFPNTVEEVLSQPGQFSTWKKIKYIEHTEEQEEALRLVSLEEPILDFDFLYFNGTPFVRREYVQIQDHYFCKGRSK